MSRHAQIPRSGLVQFLLCGAQHKRKGMGTLAVLVQQALGHDPFLCGTVYAFRGRRGGRVTFYIPPVRCLAKRIASSR